MVSDSFLATSASNAVAFASDRNWKCHIICPCVTKSVWQLTSRPVTEGPETLKNGPWLFKGIAWICVAHMQHSNAEIWLSVPSLSWSLMRQRINTIPPPPLERHSPLLSSLDTAQHYKYVLIRLIVKYLNLCFWTRKGGWGNASCFSALSQISLKGFEITEADSLPVKLLGA